MSTAVPFSDPPWLLGLPSPIYTDSHRRWQAAIRPFIEKHLHSGAREWERAETVPEHVFKDFAAANMLIPALPAPLPVDWLKRLGIHELLGGLKVEDFDYLHGLIFADEMARSGLAGPSGSLTTGVAFGIPPILKFGDKQLQERFLPELLKGEKRSCIAITEPDAGSDVANITTTAVKSKCGKFYIVNGTKKWHVRIYKYIPLMSLAN
jgi:acyl-CoA dehydrogenase